MGSGSLRVSANLHPLQILVVRAMPLDKVMAGDLNLNNHIDLRDLELLFFMMLGRIPPLYQVGDLNGGKKRCFYPIREYGEIKSSYLCNASI